MQSSKKKESAKLSDTTLADSFTRSDAGQKNDVQSFSGSYDTRNVSDEAFYSAISEIAVEIHEVRHQCVVKTWPCNLARNLSFLLRTSEPSCVYLI